MSLTKAIRYQKEYRSEYYDSRRFDHTCRNHGSCSYCEHNRLYSSRRHLCRTKDELDHWEEDSHPGVGGLWEGWDSPGD
jgi:5-methylcytosine-specific restriction endonuclease McrA